MRVCTTRGCVEKALDAAKLAPATNHEFQVGAAYRDQGGMPGLVDELRLYNRALTGPEIMVVAAQ